MEATRVQLAQGVYLTYLPARKFKTSLLSAQFVTPLRQDTAGANALLAAVLRRGTVSCPDMGALSAGMAAGTGGGAAGRIGVRPRDVPRPVRAGIF